MPTTRPRAGFGALLKRQREAALLSQEELAERAGLSVEAISALERGVRRHPQGATVRRLAEALHLAPAERDALAAAAQGDSASAPPPSPDIAQPAALAPPPLVGRVAEQAVLTRHLAGEGPPLLLLAGEPGMGKTRLLREATRLAAGAGLRVLEGGCQQRGGQEPYAPLLDALAGYIRQQPPAALHGAIHGCAWLVRLLPELADGPIEPLPAWTVPPEQERRLVFDAVARLLANVAGPAGILLALDDLQWAGPDALALLTTLARSSMPGPLRMVGAYRDTEVAPDAPLAVMLADLAHAGLARQHQLAPLTDTEVDCLLDSVLAGTAGVPGGTETAALRARVVRRAGGVPFFVVSCAQALSPVSGGGPHQGTRLEAGNAEIPWDVAQGVRQRVAALAPAAREVLGAAAVVGRVVPLDLLLAVCGLPDDVIVDALDATARARLLTAEAEGYRFAHDVIREAVEADVGPARCQLLHRRVAQELERAGPGPDGRDEAPVEQLAYHYERGQVPEKALLYLERAGDKARARAAPAAAAGYYRDLIARLEGLGRALDTARVREKLATTIDPLGQAEAVRGVLEEAVRAYEASGEREGLRRVAAHIGELDAMQGRIEEGLARLRPLADAVDADAPSPGMAVLHGALASLYFHGGRYGECLAASERALAVARAAGDAGSLARATWTRSLTLTMQGRMDESLRMGAEAVRLLEATGDTLYLVFALDGMSEAYWHRGELAASRRYLTQTQEAMRLLGSSITYMIGLRGVLAFVEGDWPQARADIEGAVRAFGVSDEHHMFAYPLSELGWLCLGEGRWDEAARYLEVAYSAAASCDDIQGMRWATRGLAELDLRREMPAQARRRLLPLLDRPGLEESDVTDLLPLLAWADLALGAVGQAREGATRAVARARAHRNRLALVEALRVHALVAIRGARWSAAEQALEEGLALCQGIPFPHAEGRLLHACGEMHGQKGEPAAARERLEAARVVFQRLGARKDVERVEHAIAELQG